MKTIVGGLAIALAAFTLTACGSDTESTAPPTQNVAAEPEVVTETQTVTEVVTETVTVAPEPEPASSPSTSSSTSVDEDLAALVMEMAWAKQDAESRETMCFGWSLDKDLVVSMWLVEDFDGVTERVVREFFDSKCP